MSTFKLFNGNALEIMKSMKDESVDMVLTDPPYCNGSLVRSTHGRSTSKKIQQTGTKDLKPDFVGDNRDQRSYEKWCVEWMTEAYRLVKDRGMIASFIDWKNLACIVDAIQIAGFVYRGIYCWAKPVSRPIRGIFNSSVEFVVVGTKGEITQQEKYARNYDIVPIVQTKNRIHGTEKPVKVLENLLYFVPEGGTVLDPFCGSGSTGEACSNLGLNFIGLEYVKVYYEESLKRLNKCFNYEQ